MTYKKSVISITAILLLIFAVSTARAEDCLNKCGEISGKISTISLDLNNQLGFIKAKGKLFDVPAKVEGGIFGKIVGYNQYGPILNHTISFPGYGIINTEQDQAIIIGVDPENPCNLVVKESIKIKNGTGVFAEISGGEGLVEGTIYNPQCGGDGENTFTFEATLCCD